MSHADIRIGATREESVIVHSGIAISFLGPETARVLATPQMIQHMEITSRNLLKPMLEEGYDSVGTDVSVKHLGATPIGMEVVFRSEVIKRDDRRITFHVTARDANELIGEGTHERFVIHIERFAAKMQSKLAGKDNVI